VILPILHKYGVPSEFAYLAAIESSYYSRALSSAGAFGYWQFLKSTAQSGPAGADSYDWKMSMTKWKDDRADLIHSTHSAAKYLAWMNRVMKVKLDGDKEREGFDDWLLTAAAYNAGPKRVLERLNGFGASSYWDVPLPTETERYVPRWIAVGIISSHREFYGVQIPPGRPVSFEAVKNVSLKKDLTIHAMAELLNITPRAVWTLNTQIPPEKSVFPAKSGRKSITHTIYVPKGTRTKFLAQLKAHGYTDK
jgi:membrane-bound lytic murein transglycosylase D